MAQKAAALVQSCAANHGFADGNKRTTLILVNLLMLKSGYQLAMTHQQSNAELERIILATVRRQITLEELVLWFKERLARI